MLKVNAIGDNCPIPVIKTKKAMQEVDGKETIEVLVDNEIAVQNVTKMASSAGTKVTSEKSAFCGQWKERESAEFGLACTFFDSPVDI